MVGISQLTASHKGQIQHLKLHCCMTDLSAVKTGQKEQPLVETDVVPNHSQETCQQGA
jgi:hypothetical protein